MPSAPQVVRASARGSPPGSAAAERPRVARGATCGPRPRLSRIRAAASASPCLSSSSAIVSVAYAEPGLAAAQLLGRIELGCEHRGLRDAIRIDRPRPLGLGRVRRRASSSTGEISCVEADGSRSSCRRRAPRAARAARAPRRRAPGRAASGTARSRRPRCRPRPRGRRAARARRLRCGPRGGSSPRARRSRARPDPPRPAPVETLPLHRLCHRPLCSRSGAARPRRAGAARLSSPRISPADRRTLSARPIPRSTTYWICPPRLFLSTRSAAR